MPDGWLAPVHRALRLVVEPLVRFSASATAPGVLHGFAGLAGHADLYDIFSGGKPGGAAGTSAVAPLWAGLAARLNQAVDREIWIRDATFSTALSSLISRLAASSAVARSDRFGPRTCFLAVGRTAATTRTLARQSSSCVLLTTPATADRRRVTRRSRFPNRCNAATTRPWLLQAWRSRLPLSGVAAAVAAISGSAAAAPATDNRSHGASWPGSSSTLHRGAGQCSAAHSKKLASSSSFTVPCLRPRTSQGFSGSCSVTVYLNSGKTNVCSHSQGRLGRGSTGVRWTRLDSSHARRIF